MIIRKIEIDGFKNLKNVVIKPSKSVNVFYGNNAQGKTNLMEALWLLTGERSFRCGNTKDYVGFGREYATISVEYETEERPWFIQCHFTNTPPYKTIYLNGSKVNNTADLRTCGYKGISFTPDDLSITKGGPDIRRCFLDDCLTVASPIYGQALKKYERNLLQRNALLKEVNLGNSPENELDMWEADMASSAAAVVYMRNNFIGSLNKYGSQYYSKLTSGKENMTVEYLCSTHPDVTTIPNVYKDGTYRFIDILRDTRDADIAAGYTALGPHRDDFLTKVDGYPVKENGSQGQNRSCALCMKLGYSRLYKNILHTEPIVILDDVLSELDAERQNFIISEINEMQVFITCCEPPRGITGKFFEVSDGVVTEKYLNIAE